MFVYLVHLQFSSDNRQSWTDIVESTSANTRAFEWPAPNITSTECLIKISDMANPDVFDITETPFTLCKLELVSPNGYAFYRVGSPVEVTWTSEEVGNLTLSYLTVLNGEWTTVEENIPVGNNSYEWIPTEASSTYRVQLKETNYPELIDESDNNFVVFRLDLTAPQGGEDLIWNEPFDIAWDSEIINSVKIEFSEDNMQSWSTIVGNTSAGSGSYNWTVPEISSSDCFIKLTAPQLPDLYSANATPFSIFEILGVPELLNEGEFGLSLYPNPVLDNLSISLVIPEKIPTNLNLEIYNTNGEIVLTRIIENLNPGNQILDLELCELPGGLYMIKLEGKNNYSTQKFIKRTR